MPPPTTPYFSELKFQGGATLDFIEVAVDAGTNVTNIQVVVYNPNGTVRSTNSLGSLVNTEAGRDVYVIDTATSATFNGLHRNGAVALVDNGTVISFLSFNTTVTATNGPANGTSSTALGGTANGESLETSDNGATYTVQTTPNSGNVPCFLTGTRIMTSLGARPVESLVAGDLILTLDDGWQPLLWAGARELSSDELHDPSKLPTRIPAGALAPGVPSRDLYVSPNHRMMLQHPKADLYFHSDEFLAPAKAMHGHRGIARAPVATPVRYHHLLFAKHQVIWANGSPSESLHLNRMGLEGFSISAQAEIRAEIGQPSAHGPTARVALTAQETQLFMQLVERDDLIAAHGTMGLAA